EAQDYLTALRTLLLYCRVSDGNMEEGSLRCDANVSIRPRGTTALGTRIEIKNLNSFNNVRRALQHEIGRQRAVVGAGGRVEQETRLWNAERAETVPMRGKEEAHDYRYFPDPDLRPLRIAAEWVEGVRASLPELPAERRRRLVAAHGLPPYDASVLTGSRELADYYEAAAAACGSPKAASNWVMTEVLRKLNEARMDPGDAPVTPQGLGELVRLIESGTLSGKLAKEVFERMWSGRESAAAIVEHEGLRQVSDEAAIRSAVAAVLAASPDQVRSYRGGRAAAMGWFVGQVMKHMGGKANPQLVNRLLKETLDEH
ncbi:MAG TPA: Asp-tRNA(Asn)/Glu-tRNA(Gln) amidotransferase subunit GatB, partial [Vicinamibacteria bacterium]|nr:Asp-tRNA(Asn)/Glu-tRNA(Gln) amidotransferase subunit GatB [Vicinamibacteria bacterium]